MNSGIANGPGGKKVRDYVRPTPYLVIIIVPTVRDCAHSHARPFGSKLTMNVMDGIHVTNIGGLTTIPRQLRTTGRQFSPEMTKPRPLTAPTSATTRDGTTPAGSTAVSTLTIDLNSDFAPDGDSLRPQPQCVENSEDDHDMDLGRRAGIFLKNKSEAHVSVEHRLRIAFCFFLLVVNVLHEMQ